MDKYGDLTIEERLRSIGLPDDFPETVLAGETAPPREALERIKATALTRIGMKTAVSTGGKLRPYLAWWKPAAAVLLALILAITLWIGPDRVWAGLREAFNLVPGFGMVNRNDERLTLVSVEQVRAERDGGYVQLAGVLAQSEATYVKLFFKDVPGYSMDMNDYDYFLEFYSQVKAKMGRIYLVDDKGTVYRPRKGAQNRWYYSRNRYGLHNDIITYFTLQLPPLSALSRRVALVVPVESGPDLTLEVNLLPLEEARQWSQNTQTVTVGDVTVTAAVYFGYETWVSLAVEPLHEGARVDRIDSGHGFAEVNGSKGGWYPLLRQGQPWQSNYMEQFHQQVVDGEESVTVSFGSFLFREEGQTRITLPIPREGYQEVEIPFTLGRFSFTVTGVEETKSYRFGHTVTGPDGTWTEYNEKTIVAYIEPAYEGQEQFQSCWTSTGLLGQNHNESSCGRINEYGDIQLYVAVKQNQRNVRVTLRDPAYSVEGPWHFTFPVE